MDAMAAIRETFFQECEEQLAELEAGLGAMLDGGADPETVNAVFRAVHSIKGGAGAFGLAALVRFAHRFETTLDHLRAGRLPAAPEPLRLMLRAADALADLVGAARDGTSLDPDRFEALVAELAALDPAVQEGADAEPEPTPLLSFTPVPLDDSIFDEPASEPRERVFRIRLRPHPALYAKGNETALLLRELSRLGRATTLCDASALPSLDELDPEGAYLAFEIRLATGAGEGEIREIFDFVEGDCDLDIVEEGDDAAGEGGAEVTAQMSALVERLQRAVEAERSSLAARRQAGRAAAQAPEAVPARTDDARPEPKTPSIRVDLERVDRLINLVGELVINQAVLTQRAREEGIARAAGVAGGLDELEQLTRQIQESVMAIRAQPVRAVFQRMPRLVREVAALTGKEVRLVMEGEATEVDKTVIERLADPLTHMIRNAIDHGLETPEARSAAGKPREGLVRLSARHRSGRIVIAVEDDGAGVDRARVRAVAAGKGLIAPDAALADEEIDNLIFLPGFSTAAEISDVSGRGVGMDVVRSGIEALGGRISIQSRPGRGSTFLMSLPLTLAVLDGMVVTVAGQTLVAPLSAIVETLQPREGDVRGFLEEGRVLSIRGGFAPLVDLCRELGYRASAADPAQGVAVLVEADGGARGALLVDAILGQRQVVVKSLEANYGRAPGVAAATILGDGRVALILDVDALLARARAEPAPSSVGAPGERLLAAG
ncbi:chemotaxis protein CheA [Methylocella sp.]|uniref:chemotaxis protein CheA n=1 Tax=Methylocella sp. TaxID=1978226 RepID=UPI003783BCF7